MADESVSVLSASKQRRSLGASKKREKLTKKPTRTSVVNPGEIEWPDVDEDASKEILDLAESTLKCLDIPVKKCPLKVISAIPVAERPEFRRNWMLEQNLKLSYYITERTLVRSTVTIGVNLCSKAMQLNMIAALIIEKDVDPSIITRMLIPIALSKGVPIVSLSGLRLACKQACDIRCIALGFKKSCEITDSPFYNLLQTVKEYGKKLEDIQQRTPSSFSVPNPVSDNIISSPAEDEETPSKTQRKTFSIQEELTKLETKVRERSAKRQSEDQPYVAPKIRRVPPK